MAEQEPISAKSTALRRPDRTKTRRLLPAAAGRREPCSLSSRAAATPTMNSTPPSLEIAEEPGLACDRANSAARRHPADGFSRCRRRSRQSQSPQRRDCEPSALLLLERGASHESAGRRPKRGEDLYECNVSDRQCCGEPARSLLGPARPGTAQLEPAAGARALGAVCQARADARARRARLIEGFLLTPGVASPACRLSAAGVSLASRNLRESRMGFGR